MPRTAMVPNPFPPPRRLPLRPAPRSALLPPWVVAGVLTSPLVRPEAVARGHALLSEPTWCHAGEVAHALVGCYMAPRP